MSQRFVAELARKDAEIADLYNRNGEVIPLRLNLEEAKTENQALRAEVERLAAQLNTPELQVFSAGVVSEAQHQRARWGSDHDAGKEPHDWFWLLGYLAGKALKAHSSGDTEKALHHAISSAAVLANWHAAILGQTNMRPGIDPAERGYDAARSPAAQGTKEEGR